MTKATEDLIERLEKRDRRIQELADKLERKRQQQLEQYHSGGVVPSGTSTVRVESPTTEQIERFKQELAKAHAVPSQITGTSQDQQFEREIDLLLSMAARFLRDESTVPDALEKMHAAYEHAVRYHRRNAEEDVKGVTPKQTSLYDEPHPGTSEMNEELRWKR